MTAWLDERNDFFGQGVVIVGAVAARCVVENRLSKTGGFGQADVAADSRVKELRVAIELAATVFGLEELVDVRADFRSQSRIAVVHAQHHA